MKTVILACLVAFVVAQEKRQFLPGHGFHDVLEISHCQRQSTTQLCDQCCRSAHFTVSLEERGCENLCKRSHHDKRQLGHGGHGIQFPDLAEISQCQQQSTTELCNHCCRSAYFALPLEETACETLCQADHNKRQLLGHGFHDVLEISHCQRQSTTQLCDQCCRSAHFTVSLEERGCENLCQRTHHDKKRLLIDILHLYHYKEISHCWQQSTTELCDQCCRSSHFNLPSEERYCKTQCNRTQHDKRQLPGHGFHDVLEISHCQRQSTTQLCDQCCRSSHFTVSLEERGCENLCQRTHHNKRRFLPGSFPHDLLVSAHCHRQNTTELCDQCCKSSHFTVSLDKRRCETMCNTTQHDKRQLLGHGFHDLELFRQCQRESSTASCTRCCHAADFHVDAEQRGCDTLCRATHHGNKRQVFGHAFLDLDREIIRQCLNEDMKASCTDCCHAADFYHDEDEQECVRQCAVTHHGNEGKR
ncbi:hypothetical protein V1264_016248 [Littorina saxatilis]|uniref:Uncharacterized protein n=1 Tax=Littorina saxatilis TaxID=31220 RepID=A0AAN9GGX8_9CAEN